MKKAFIFIPLVAMTLAYSSFATADGYYGGEHRHHGHHHGHGHHRDYDGYSNQQPIYYQAPPVVQYYAPPPQVNYYQAPQPPVHYRRPAEQQYNYDPRTHQGLAGGVVGSVFGYEMGRGDPVATGLGAAAGAFVGNRW